MSNKVNELLLKLQATIPMVQPLLQEAQDLGVPKWAVNQMVDAYGTLVGALTKLQMGSPEPTPEPIPKPEPVTHGDEHGNTAYLDEEAGAVQVALNSGQLRHVHELVELFDDLPATIVIDLSGSGMTHPIDFGSGVISIHNPDNAKWLLGFEKVEFRAGNTPGVYGELPSGSHVVFRGVEIVPAESQKACVLLNATSGNARAVFLDCSMTGSKPLHLWGIHFKYGHLTAVNCIFSDFGEHGVYAHSPVGLECSDSKFSRCGRTGIQVSRRGTEPFFKDIGHDPHVIVNNTMREIGPDGSAISIWGANDSGMVMIRDNDIEGTGGGIYLGDEVVYNSISKEDKLAWAEEEGLIVSMTNHGGLFIGPDADKANKLWKSTEEDAPARKYAPAHKRWGNFPIQSAVVLGNKVDTDGHDYSFQGAKAVHFDYEGPFFDVTGWNVSHTFLTQSDVPNLLDFGSTFPGPSKSNG